MYIIHIENTRERGGGGGRERERERERERYGYRDRHRQTEREWERERERAAASLFCHTQATQQVSGAQRDMYIIHTENTTDRERGWGGGRRGGERERESERERERAAAALFCHTQATQQVSGVQRDMYIIHTENTTDRERGREWGGRGQGGERDRVRESCCHTLATQQVSGAQRDMYIIHTLYHRQRDRYRDRQTER